MVLGWNNQNCYLKVFYNFFTSSLLKLLQKAKKKKKKIIPLGVGPAVPKKAKNAAMNLGRREKGFKLKFSETVSDVDAYTLN